MSDTVAAQSSVAITERHRVRRPVHQHHRSQRTRVAHTPGATRPAIPHTLIDRPTAADRLPRNHYVLLGSNYYSIHPSAVGRRIEVIIDPHRVSVLYHGRVVAEHIRSWAQNQWITDPNHLQAVA